MIVAAFSRSGWARFSCLLPWATLRDSHMSIFGRLKQSEALPFGCVLDSLADIATDLQPAKVEVSWGVCVCVGKV